MHAHGVKRTIHAGYGFIAYVQVIVTISADANDMDVSKEQGDLPFNCSSSSVLFSPLTCFYVTPRLALAYYIQAQHQQTIV